MDELLKGLMAAGYFVRFQPGKFDTHTQAHTPGGVMAVIESRDAVTMGRIHESWSAHGETPERALTTAAFKLREHMRPAYEGYLAVAEAVGWER